ncbi:MAG: L-ribulose-5-phosphate 4-epimerase [Kiritimatiellae bacterium]|nr:L-ribulose-5-phosphate 4-epimerase [Kiritimatiellia bacterium]
MEELRREVYEANCSLDRHGLVTLTWGNVSGIDREAGLVVIKPSGVAYPELTPERLVVVDLDGHTVEGRLAPSSDLPTHLILYESFAGIGGVTHTHSPYATVFAQACRPIPCFGTTHADNFHGEVPVTRGMTREEVTAAYEANTGNVIVERFATLDPGELPAVLVANHGPFTWGTGPADSVENSVVLEEVARMAFGTLLLSPGQPPIARHLLDKHYLRKHGAGAYYGQRDP